MKTQSILLCTVFLALAQINTVPAATDPGASAPADLVQLVNNTVICGFSVKVLPENVPTFVNDIAQFTGAEVRHIYTTAIKGFSAHMSLNAAEQLMENNPKHKNLFNVRPGLTGLMQLNGRVWVYENFNEAVKMESNYVLKNNLMLDLMIFQNYLLKFLLQLQLIQHFDGTDHLFQMPL